MNTISIPKISETIEYRFNCPIHGPETQGFCFRAFDESLHRCWEKVLITPRILEWNPGELDKTMDLLKRVLAP